MKKSLFSIVCIMLCFAMIFCFVGCGQTKTNTTKRSAINFDLEQTDSQQVVKVKTNLPENTLVSIQIANKSFNCVQQAKVTKDGKDNVIVSNVIKDENGNKIKDGTYVAVFTSELPSKQPEDVRKIIGEKGEKLTGVNIYEKDGELITRKITNFKVEDGIFKDNPHAND